MSWKTVTGTEIRDPDREPYTRVTVATIVTTTNTMRTYAGIIVFVPDPLYRLDIPEEGLQPETLGPTIGERTTRLPERNPEVQDTYPRGREQGGERP